ncbi:MAG TPA: hypothetical protein VLI55_01700 [Bryobacteraceae bacterium]|nr:hypothetical protein [Bryobacteraceae bacterium]
MRLRALAKPGLLWAVLLTSSSWAAHLDLAPFAHLTAWTDKSEASIADLQSSDNASSIGLIWDEERDIREIRVDYSGRAETGVRVEYWFKNWPYDPPHMPSIEDPMDDPWQGKWLRAEVRESRQGRECRYVFSPLSEAENPRAGHMPGVAYRRTLKVRLVYPGRHARVRELQAYSDTEEMPRQIAIQLGTGNEMGSEWSGWFSAYNGAIRSVRANGFDAADRVESDGHWRFRTSAQKKVLLVDLIAATPKLPGSNDVTVVTVHAQRREQNVAETAQDRTFSFSVDDFEHGPIIVPFIEARVTNTSGSSVKSATRRRRIRERIPEEPEQTYERASREIPTLDPWNREWGGPLYLPLAVDTSWQKFAFELGGSVYISKSGLKAKPAELKRLNWPGDRLTWRFGTGTKPYYRQDHRVAMHPLDGYFPVPSQSWESEGISYTEEAFATLLRGPLSPEDPARNEQTPAILMLQLRAENRSPEPKQAVVWLSTEPGEPLRLNGNALLAGNALRAEFEMPEGSTSGIARVSPGSGHAVRIAFEIPGGQKRALVIKLPAVSDLDDRDARDLHGLHYESERARVVGYWRKIVDAAARFSVPEPKFNQMLRSTVTHIHITATKDPKSGLVMLPAASYIYDVYENESCYQLLLLDALGQAGTAAAYLEPMLKLQGSKDFPGNHRGSTAGIFHGVKVSDNDDYTANGYGLDHGTVLWTAAQHYLYTRDAQWFSAAWPHLQKAIQWIVDQRAVTKRYDEHGAKVREFGLLPASQLEDNVDWANWFSINAFAWAGMDLTAQALADLGRPEAAAVKQQADAYRADLRQAVLRASRAAPVARMQDGVYEPYVPTVPTRRFRLFGRSEMNYYKRYGGPEIKPLLRLGADRDTLSGAVLLLILGVFNPDEPIADWVLNDWEDNETLSSGMGMNIHGMTDDGYWFSQGGMVFQANLINPIPVYLKRHEAAAAIRNLYNDYVACLYPNVNVFTEEFHQWHHPSGPFYKSSDEARFVNRVRDALVLEDRDTLWLAAGTPRRWLASQEGIHVTDAQTFFGPVSYEMHPGAERNTVEATVMLPSRNPARTNWMVIRTPTGKIRSVTLNGHPWTKIDPRLEAVQLPTTQREMHLHIEY